MRRRDLVKLVVAAGTWPLAAGAQQKRIPVIGWLSSTSPDAHQQLLAAFRQGLSEAGYAEGQNMAVEYRTADGHFARLPSLAADLVNSGVDLIIAAGTPAAPAAKSATSSVPIVFSYGDDPVEDGLITSLARPGGNLTGISFGLQLNPKRLELISELVSQAVVVGLLVNPTRSSAERVIGDMREAAHKMGIQLPVVKASTESEIDAAFITFVQLHVGGLIVVGDPFFSAQRERIVALAARDRVPAIYAEREYADSGGLISYGASLAATFRQVGIYAAKILKGEKPADLPVQQPTKFELVLNLKTAHALGLAVPQSLLARADEVIE